MNVHLFKSHWFLVSTIVVCLIWFSGCSDEEPNAIVEIPTATRTSPLNAWQGVQWSLDQHDPSGWVGSIGVEFEYHPDPTSVARYPGAFESWDREVELNFVEELFVADIVFDAQMLPDGFAEPSPTSNVVSWEAVEYSVHVQSSEGNFPIQYSGVANLEFRIEGNFWHLISWQDIRGGIAPWNPEIVFPTLGELRAVFRTK